MKRKILKNIEWGILICTIVLVAIGLVALTSATQNSNYDELKKQIIWVVISFPILIIIIFIDSVGLWHCIKGIMLFFHSSKLLMVPSFIHFPTAAPKPVITCDLLKILYACLAKGCAFKSPILSSLLLNSQSFVI